MEIEGIDHVALAVADVERAAKWYADVLGLERRYEGRWNEVPTFIGKGTTALALFPATTPEAKAGPRKTAGMLHLAFRADRKSFLTAQEELKQRRIHFTFEDHEISHSIYFRDLDNHVLEITTYELVT